MAGERDIDGLSRLIGRLEEQIKTLFKKIDDMEEKSTAEHKAVHAIVIAMTDAVRTMSAKVDEMKPLTDDYREKRAEGRGFRKLVAVLYVTFGGMAGAVASKLIDYLSVRPHP